MSNKHAKVLDAANMSIVTQKKVLIFQTLESYLVDDCIDIVYQFSRQPVIMSIGHPKNKHHQQELKGFDPASNTWLDFTTLPMIPQPVKYLTKAYYKNYDCVALTRISPYFDRLLISVEIASKHVFYEFNINTNQCVLVDTPCYLKKDFQSHDNSYENKTRLNHLNEMVLVEDGDDIKNNDDLKCDDSHNSKLVGQIIANIQEWDTGMMYPFLIGHTSNKTERCELNHLDQPTQISSIDSWHCNVIYKNVYYMYFRGSIREFDLGLPPLTRSSSSHTNKKARTEWNTFDELRDDDGEAKDDKHKDSPEMIIRKNVLYLIGGGTGYNSAVKTCSRYDLTVKDVGHDIASKKKLMLMADLNRARYNSQACIVDEQIFVFGGFGGDHKLVREVESYDEKSNEWKVISQLPEHWDTFISGKTAVLYF